MTELELAIEQKILADKLTQLTKQTAQWKAIFLNDARIYAENPTSNNKLNMDISAKQLQLNERWKNEAWCRYVAHQTKYGVLLN
jgi:hypothetical protein